MTEGKALSREALIALARCAPDLKDDLQPLQSAPDPKRPTKEPDLCGYAYFVFDGRAIKIGSAQDVWRRIGELETAHAHDLHLLGYVPQSVFTESDLHDRFTHLRIKREWFQPEREIYDFIEQLKLDGHLILTPRPDDAARTARKDELRIKGVPARVRSTALSPTTGERASPPGGRARMYRGARG